MTSLSLKLIKRRHPDSNWGIKALQAPALPLGYAATDSTLLYQYIVKMRQPFLENSPQTSNAYLRIQRISKFLDNAIVIPGTSYRVGVDPLLGLFPGVGDYFGAFLSGYIVLEAAKIGASRVTLIRMIVNVVIDTIVGLVPGMGDIFDVFWKANARNMMLLQKQLESGERREKADWLFLGGLLLILLIIVLAMASFSFWILVSLIQASPFFGITLMN